MKEKIFKFIKRFIAGNGYAPTIREICKGTGIGSTSSVSKYLWQLEFEGHIRCQIGKPRTIVILKELEGDN